VTFNLLLRCYVTSDRLKRNANPSSAGAVVAAVQVQNENTIDFVAFVVVLESVVSVATFGLPSPQEMHLVAMVPSLLVSSLYKEQVLHFFRPILKVLVEDFGL